MAKIARDMTQAQFAEACERYGFKPEGFMGYYRLPGPYHICISVWNAGKRRRDWLAYLIRESEKAQRRHAQDLLLCGGCKIAFDNDIDIVDYQGRKWHSACVEQRKADLAKAGKFLGVLNGLMQGAK